MARSIVVRRNHPAALDAAAARQLHERISRLAVVCLPVTTLMPNPRNAKQHPDKQIRLLAENIRKFGVTHPILVDETDTILAGHARFEALKLLKSASAPVIRITDLNSQEKRALALADNKLAELGTWNTEILGDELKQLMIDTAELSIDYALTGFDTVEIDQLLGGDPSLGKPDPADEVSAPVAGEPPATRPGDLWICGNHRLLCGDALDAASYRVLLAGEQANIVFTDPPYNVPNAGYVSRRANVREFPMASGELSVDDFTYFLELMATHIADNVVDGAVIYLCMDWRHLDELLAATKPYFGKPKDMVVWVKSNAGQGSFYRSQHEHIAVYVAGNAAPTNNFRLGERGRYRSNCWQYPDFNSFGPNRDAALSVPPTMKPVALVADALRDCSKRGEIVLDPFAGSGTTMIAAERTGRRARLMEIDTIYCDAVVRRWDTFSTMPARLAETNETLAEVAVRRCRPARPGSETGSSYPEPPNDNDVDQQPVNIDRVGHDI